MRVFVGRADPLRSVSDLSGKFALLPVDPPRTRRIKSNPQQTRTILVRIGLEQNNPHKLPCFQSGSVRRDAHQPIRPG